MTEACWPTCVVAPAVVKPKACRKLLLSPGAPRTMLCGPVAFETSCSSPVVVFHDAITPAFEVLIELMTSCRFCVAGLRLIATPLIVNNVPLLSAMLELTRLSDSFGSMPPTADDEVTVWMLDAALNPPLNVVRKLPAPVSVTLSAVPFVVAIESSPPWIVALTPETALIAASRALSVSPVV